MTSSPDLSGSMWVPQVVLENLGQQQGHNDKGGMKGHIKTNIYLANEVSRELRTI